MIDALLHSLHAMGVQQYLMAFLFLGCYSMALSQFVGTRARHYAAAGAASAAVAFAALTDPWMHGVLVVAIALVAIGLFAAAAWGLWALLGWPHEEHEAWRLAGHDAIEEAPLSFGAAAEALAQWAPAAIAALRRPRRLLIRAEQPPR